MSTRLVSPAVCMITRGEVTRDNFDQEENALLANIRNAVDSGVSMVQIRERRLSARLLFSLVHEAAEITKNSSTRLLVNDRIDVALAAGADGVHLASTSLPLKLIREKFGGDILIGVSTHAVEEVLAAKSGGADFVVFGPVFSSPGKTDPVGLESLRTVCRLVEPFAVLGLGGIDERNYRSVLDAGASGFAAIRSLNESKEMSSIMSGINK